MKIKFILLPLTMILWYLTAFYGTYIAVIGVMFMFSLSWLWLIIGYLFFVGAVFGISNGLPSLLRFIILKYYGKNWFSSILHSLAGIIGVVHIIQFFILSPPELVISNESFFFITGMWELSPFKTIFLAFPSVGLMVSLLWSTIFAPLYMNRFADQI